MSYQLPWPDGVQERQERCRIVEQELLSARQRLERDCAKARTYQELRQRLQLGRQQELVLTFEAAQKGLRDLQLRHQQLGEQELRDVASLKEAEEKLAKAAANLKTLQENGKNNVRTH